MNSNRIQLDLFFSLIRKRDLHFIRVNTIRDPRELQKTNKKQCNCWFQQNNKNLSGPSISIKLIDGVKWITWPDETHNSIRVKGTPGELCKCICFGCLFNDPCCFTDKLFNFLYSRMAYRKSQYVTIIDRKIVDLSNVEFWFKLGLPTIKPIDI